MGGIAVGLMDASIYVLKAIEFKITLIRNFEKSIEKRLYWKSVMAHSAMGTLNFNSASKYAMQDVHN